MGNNCSYKDQGEHLDSSLMKTFKILQMHGEFLATGLAIDQVLAIIELFLVVIASPISFSEADMCSSSL